MREEVLKYLSELNAEELSVKSTDVTSQRNIYSKSGRFIIERRTMSSISTGKTTAPICLRAHPRFSEFPDHTHDYVEFMYVCAGSITHNISEQKVRVGCGDIIALGKSTKHSIEPTGENDIGINIIISSELFEGILNSIRRDAALRTKTDESLLDKSTSRFYVFHTSQSVEISNLLESMIYSALVLGRNDDYVLEQSVRLLVCYLCTLTENVLETEELTENDKIKKKLLKYVRTSYSTATLTEAASILGLSPTYLSRWTHAAFGCGFKELLMNERFSVACDLLRSTDKPIGDIIILVGYENSSYFHKEFKKRYGMTPKDYRRTDKPLP